MKSLADAAPWYAHKPEHGNRANATKGTQIMEGLLLNQYQNSPNLKEYYSAFIAELDFLFEQIEEVHLGRFLENAVGAQLDVIGIILRQTRAVSLPTQWFGFQGAVDADGMADQASPAEGGLFRDANLGESAVTPLDDATYRRMLYVRAIASNRDTADINLAYYLVSILLERVPSTFELRDQDSGTGLANRTVELVLSRASISSKEVSLIIYMSKHFVPAGVTFIITQV